MRLGELPLTEVKTPQPPVGQLVKAAVVFRSSQCAKMAALAATSGRQPLLKVESPFWKSSWAYSPDVRQLYTYDPARAKRLLTEAGFPNGFKTTILSNTSFAMHQNTAVTVQSGLKAIGVDAQLTLFDFPQTLR